MYIIMKGDEFFIVDVVEDSDFIELKEIIEMIGKENLRMYFTIYRTIMGIALDVTPSTERMLLAARYGEPLFDSKEFISNIILAQRDFEAKKASPPDALLWLVERGAEVVPADGVLQV